MPCFHRKPFLAGLRGRVGVSVGLHLGHLGDPCVVSPYPRHGSRHPHASHPSPWGPCLSRPSPRGPVSAAPPLGGLSQPPLPWGPSLTWLPLPSPLGAPSQPASLSPCLGRLDHWLLLSLLSHLLRPLPASSKQASFHPGAILSCQGCEAVSGHVLGFHMWGGEFALGI